MAFHLIAAATGSAKHACNTLGIPYETFNGSCISVVNEWDEIVLIGILTETQGSKYVDLLLDPNHTYEPGALKVALNAGVGYAAMRGKALRVASPEEETLKVMLQKGFKEIREPRSYFKEADSSPKSNNGAEGPPPDAEQEPQVAKVATKAPKRKPKARRKKK